MNELGDFSYLGVSRGAYCGASIVVQFAAQHCSSLCSQSEGGRIYGKKCNAFSCRRTSIFAPLTLQAK